MNERGLSVNNKLQRSWKMVIMA